MKLSETISHSLNFHMIQLWMDPTYSETCWNMLKPHVIQFWNVLKYYEAVWNSLNHSDTSYETNVKLSEILWSLPNQAETSYAAGLKLYEILWNLPKLFRCSLKLSMHQVCNFMINHVTSSAYTGIYEQHSEAQTTCKLATTSCNFIANVPC